MNDNKSKFLSLASYFDLDLASSVADAVGTYAFGIPGLNIPVDLINAIKNKKIKIERKILLEEISAGHVEKLDDESKVKLIPMGYHFVLASRLGAAKNNLRILARLMNDQISKMDVDPIKFKDICDAILGLNKFDLLLLSLFMKRYDKWDKHTRNFDHRNKREIFYISVALMHEIEEEFVLKRKLGLQKYKISLSNLLRKGWIYIIDPPEMALNESRISVSYAPSSLLGYISSIDIDDLIDNLNNKTGMTG